MNLYNLRSYIIEWLQYAIRFVQLYFKSTHTIRMENIALRSQLTLYVQRYEKEKLPKPRPTPAFWQLWVLLSKNMTNWKEVLLIVRPETVIRWHRTAFKMYCIGVNSQRKLVDQPFRKKPFNSLNAYIRKTHCCRLRKFKKGC